MSSSTPFDTKSILELDGYLEPFIPAIAHRYDKFRQWKDSINVHEGGYDSFSKGYLKFGLNVHPGGEIVYREWAPNAAEAFLIGDFSESCSSRRIIVAHLNVRRRLEQGISPDE